MSWFGLRLLCRDLAWLRAPVSTASHLDERHAWLLVDLMRMPASDKSLQQLAQGDTAFVQL